MASRRTYRKMLGREMVWHARLGSEIGDCISEVLAVANETRREQRFVFNGVVTVAVRPGDEPHEVYGRWNTGLQRSHRERGRADG